MLLCSNIYRSDHVCVVVSVHVCTECGYVQKKMIILSMNSRNLEGGRFTHLYNLSFHSGTHSQSVVLYRIMYTLGSFL